MPRGEASADAHREVLDEPDGGATAAEASRSLIRDVVLRPGPKRGQVEAEPRGRVDGNLRLRRKPSETTDGQS